MDTCTIWASLTGKKSNSVFHIFIDLVFGGSDFTIDLAAEELRAAIREIGRITGRVGVEEILDVVFRDFCIGK